MYEITQYQEGFIDRQVEIGTEVMSQWKYQNQSSKELIQQIYTREDFDPETRLYAFQDGEMVGYLPSKIVEEDDKLVALYEFPIVLPNHDEEVGPLLIDKSLEVLKDKGVDEIRARVSRHWGKTEEYAEKYEFSWLFDTLVTAEIDTDDLDADEFNSHEQVKEMEYDNEEHIEAFSDSFVQRFPMRYEGEINEWIEYYKGLNKASQLLYFEDDKVMGHLIAVLREGQEQQPVVTAFYSQGEDQGRKLKFLLEELLSRITDKDYTKINLALGTEQIEYLEDLEELGIEFTTQVSRYGLKLE